MRARLNQLKLKPNVRFKVEGGEGGAEDEDEYEAAGGGGRWQGSEAGSSLTSFPSRSR